MQLSTHIPVFTLGRCVVSATICRRQDNIARIGRRCLIYTLSGRLEMRLSDVRWWLIGSRRGRIGRWRRWSSCSKRRYVIAGHGNDCMNWHRANGRCIRRGVILVGRRRVRFVRGRLIINTMLLVAVHYLPILSTIPRIGKYNVTRKIEGNWSLVITFLIHPRSEQMCNSCLWDNCLWGSNRGTCWSCIWYAGSDRYPALFYCHVGG